MIEKTSPPVPVEVAPETSTSSASQVIAPTQVTGWCSISYVKLINPMDKQSEPDLKCNIKCMKLLIEGWVPGSTGEDSRLPALSSSDFFSFGNTLMGTPLIGFFQAV